MNANSKWERALRSIVLGFSGAALVLGIVYILDMNHRLAELERRAISQAPALPGNPTRLTAASMQAGEELDSDAVSDASVEDQIAATAPIRVPTNEFEFGSIEHGPDEFGPGQLAVGEHYSQFVRFPVGRFTAEPKVFLSIANLDGRDAGDGAVVDVRVMPGSVTADGFQLVIAAKGATAMESVRIDWLAVGQTGG